jgi:hypothetical protein
MKMTATPAQTCSKRRRLRLEDIGARWSGLRKCWLVPAPNIRYARRLLWRRNNCRICGVDFGPDPRSGQRVCADCADATKGRTL